MNKEEAKFKALDAATKVAYHNNKVVEVADEIYQWLIGAEPEE